MGTLLVPGIKESVKSFIFLEGTIFGIIVGYYGALPPRLQIVSVPFQSQLHTTCSTNSSRVGWHGLS